MDFRPRISFEIFPPKTPEGAVRLEGEIKKLASLSPSFISITYGAGGSGQNGTFETLTTVSRQTKIEAVPHVTCIGSSRAGIRSLLDRYLRAGVKRIVALRGDLPTGTEGQPLQNEFRYANELVSFIREEYGSELGIEVAAYPEMHLEAPTPRIDFENFLRKLEAGADGAVTQLFYNAESYFDFMERCSKANVRVPIVPGIMPITSFASLQRFCQSCGADLPRWMRLRLEELQDDKPSLRQLGHIIVARLCRTLLENGAPGLHFFTINQAEPTIRLCETLGLQKVCVDSSF